jgi:hypothetical protein
MKLGPRIKVALGMFVIIGLLTGWQAIQYWLHRGYSHGERTGYIRKLSVKGPPYCKYAEGELALIGSPGQPSEVWVFSTDHHEENDPTLVALRQAERAGTRVTLHYRQDLKSWWRCQPNEYFVTEIEK